MNEKVDIGSLAWEAGRPDHAWTNRGFENDVQA
jgi:hypothetical protein